MQNAKVGKMRAKSESSVFFSMYLIDKAIDNKTEYDDMDE